MPGPGGILGEVTTRQQTSRRTKPTINRHGLPALCPILAQFSAQIMFQGYLANLSWVPVPGSPGGLLEAVLGLDIYLSRVGTHINLYFFPDLRGLALALLVPIHSNLKIEMLGVLITNVYT